MEDTAILPLINQLQGLSGEVLSLLLAIGCIGCIFLFGRWGGCAGLYVYNSVAVIAANIQVLKMGLFNFTPHPVALGTVTFGTCFLVSELLTEHWGKKAAIQGVWLCFGCQFLMAFMMIFTLGHRYPPGDQGHEAMGFLFVPAPRLFVASLLAFVISQLFEITLFQQLKTMTHNSHIWLRATVSSLLSALLDTVVFSVLAWVILAPTPVGWYTLIHSYILGTYVVRALMGLLSTPVIHLSYRFFYLKSHHEFI